MKCLIFGIGGQDGSYLANILLEQGHEVHGLYRRSSIDNLTRIAHIRDKVTLHQGDITDTTSIDRVLEIIYPDKFDEIYNLADQDHVGWSLDTPSYSFDVTAKAVINLLELIKNSYIETKVFQPCSAMMFGDAPPPQDENTPLNPQSPYAIAKAAAYHTARYYRDTHGMYVTTAILYNHDSERRGEEYLLHQLRQSAWDVLEGKTTEIVIGDPDMVVDIGYAKDYMEAVVKIMRLPVPNDFVIASDNPRSIRQIVNNMMSDLKCRDYTIIGNPQLLRPGKQLTLIGDTTKIRQAIGWRPLTSWMLPMIPPIGSEM